MTASDRLATLRAMLKYARLDDPPLEDSEIAAIEWAARVCEATDRELAFFNECKTLTCTSCNRKIANIKAALHGEGDTP